jgi:NADPH:quinone reductase-like Zn-dependent oxidoreductase
LLVQGGKFVTVNSLGNKGKGDLQEVKDFIEKGKLKTIIDREYTLDQIIEAHIYVEQFHKKRKCCCSSF